MFFHCKPSSYGGWFMEPPIFWLSQCQVKHLETFWRAETATETDPQNEFKVILTRRTHPRRCVRNGLYELGRILRMSSKLIISWSKPTWWFSQTFCQVFNNLFDPIFWRNSEFSLQCGTLFIAPTTCLRLSFTGSPGSPWRSIPGWGVFPKKEQHDAVPTTQCQTTVDPAAGSSASRGLGHGARGARRTTTTGGIPVIKRSVGIFKAFVGVEMAGIRLWSSMIFHDVPWCSMIFRQHDLGGIIDFVVRQMGLFHGRYTPFKNSDVFFSEDLIEIRCLNGW